MKKLTTILAAAALAIAMPVSTFANWSACGSGIMLDPGHGGSDPGASGPSAPHEAELALRCCKAMSSWLTTNGCKHKLTRTSNSTLSLSARRSASVSYDPQVFCSVHLNAFNKTAGGTETWYYWSNSRHTSLAQKVQSQLVAKLGRANRGVKQNGWTVITGASYIPAILTEGLFVDNSTEWGMINTESKAGFKGWVNGHLMGFYNFIKSEGKAISPSPDASPYGGGGGGTTPAPASGSISAPSGLHFTGYVGDEPELDLDIKGSNMKSAITIKANYAARFLVNGSNTSTTTVTVPAAGGSVKVKFADPYGNNVAGTYGSGGTANINGTSMNINFKLTLSGTGADGKTVTKDVALTGELKNRPLAPTEKWNFSETKGNKTAKGYDASQIRNFVYNNGKLYCVYQHKDILVLNAQTGEKLGFLKRGGIVKGGILQLCDVKVIDNTIIACNIGNSSSPLRVYAWSSDDANPELILETSDMQGAFRVGDCMELAGTFSSNLWLTFGAVLSESNTKTVIVEYNRQNGAWTAKNTRVYRAEDKTELSTMSTVRAYPKSGNFWIDGKDSYPTWATANATVGGVVRSTFVDTGESWGSSHHEFNFNGQKYSANLVFDGKQYLAGTETMDPDKNYLGGRMRLIADLSGDFTKMQQVGDYPSAGLGSTSRNTNATGDCMINTDGSTYWEGWVLSTTHGIAYYAHGTVPAKSPAKLELQEPEGDVPTPTIKVDKSSVSLSAITGETAKATVAVSGTELTGAVSVSIAGDAAFSVAESSVTVPGNLNITYAPTTAGSHTATITLSSAGAANVKVTLKGTATDRIVFSDEIDPAKIQSVWSFTNSNKGAYYLTTGENFTTSIALIGDKLYVLNCKAWSAPAIAEVNAYTGAKIRDINVSGVASATVQLGSLFVIDGKLYATNVVSAAQELKVYRWDDLNAAPVVAMTDATHGGVQTGRKASYALGRIWLSADGGRTLLSYAVSNGTIANTAQTIALKNAKGADFASASGDGRGSASVIDGGDGTIWVDCKDAYPTNFKLDGTYIKELKAGTLTQQYGTAFDIMPFGGQTYAAATAYASAGTDLQFINGHMHIFKVNNGVENADTPLAKLPENGFGGTTKNDQMINTIIHSYRENKQILDIWVCVPFNGIAHYSYDGRTVQAIENLDVDNFDAPVEYFNLQGVKVSGESLAPGLYIRRQGKVAEKVLVK